MRDCLACDQMMRTCREGKSRPARLHLWLRKPHRISRLMRTIIALLAVPLALATPAWAQTAPHKSAEPAKPTPAPAAAPKELGKFDDWIAATHQESGQTVCYAFVRAQHSTPTLPSRGDVILTVTERPSGRDAAAISAGFDYPKNAAVTVQVETTGLDFYTS